MAFKVTWKPVLQALALRDYHPEFAAETIMVCVNPTPESWQERLALVNEYSRRAVEVQAAMQKKQQSAEDKEKVAQVVQDFNEWSEKSFSLCMQDWFARVWSFGDDKWNVDDVAQVDHADPSLLAWMMTRSIDMIQEHRSGRKKA